MIILGIDIGLAIVGFGVIEYKDKQIHYIAHGTILTSKFDDTNTRLLNIYNDTLDLIKKYKPDVVSIEQLFYFRNSTTIISVSEARGVVLLALKQNNCEVIEITPLQVKQFVSMYGRADKKQVQKMVQYILRLDFIPKPDDAADGLALAICSINYKNKNDITYKK